MQRQLEELTKTLTELQRQNKQLTEKLAEEMARDQQAQQMRRRSFEGRWDQIMESEGKKRSSVVAKQIGETSLGRLFGSTIISVLCSPGGAAGGGEEVTWDGAGDDADDSNSQQQQQQQQQEQVQQNEGQSNGRTASMQFNTMGNLGAMAGGNNASNAMSATLGTDAKGIAAVTTALVNFQENMWSRKTGDNGSQFPQKKLGSQKGCITSVLPPISTDLALTSLNGASPKKGHSLAKQPPTPPQRNSREVDVQRSAAVLPHLFQ
ncbi:AMP deaminase 2 [Trypanosoma cruzi]|nr:AMP deaminase 2 [Trypanosoma cruzi]